MMCLHHNRHDARVDKCREAPVSFPDLVQNVLGALNDVVVGTGDALFNLTGILVGRPVGIVGVEDTLFAELAFDDPVDGVVDGALIMGVARLENLVLAHRVGETRQRPAFSRFEAEAETAVHGRTTQRDQGREAAEGPAAQADGILGQQQVL